jgi:C4-dicarboxylate transporter DctQ subunit
MALLTWRFIQVGWRVLTGEAELIIAGHEAEDLVEDATKENAED